MRYGIIHRQSKLLNWGVVIKWMHIQPGNPLKMKTKMVIRGSSPPANPHAKIFYWHHLSLKTCVCSKFVKLVARLTNSYHSVQNYANANITNVFPTFINFKEICLLGILNSFDIRILAFPSTTIIKKLNGKICVTHWLDIVF